MARSNAKLFTASLLSKSSISTRSYQGNVLGKRKVCYIPAWSPLSNNDSAYLLLPLLMTLPVSTSHTSSFGAFMHLLWTCPNHLNLAFHNLFVMEATSTLARLSSCMTISLLVSHTSILISATSIFLTKEFLIGNTTPHTRKPV